MEPESNTEIKSLLINQSNALSIIYATKERKLLSLGALWHNITIHNVATLDRELVLKALLNAVHPHDLIPVNYKVEGANAHFIARNCGAAIEKLCRDNLVVPNPDGQAFILSILLGYSNTTETQLNVQSNILGTITKRFNKAAKILNLDSFHKDADLSELIFCILSQPKILYFVLHLSKSLSPQTLKLSNNELRILSPIEVLYSVKTLTSLDLRNNLIDNIYSLAVLKSMHITELWLDGNPVCNNYDEIGYIQAVKEVCPSIEKLDGMMLGTKGFLAFRRNFVSATESTQIVDQFLAHYFQLYDSGDRRCLDGLYHPDAIFSLSCSYLHGQSTSSHAILEKYKRLSRNLFKLSDVSKFSEQLIQGSYNIIIRLCSLPLTEHDPYTFTVDVVYYSAATCVLTVTGAFREPREKMNEVEGLYGFSRTFVLQGQSNGEYIIMNEMLHVTNATTSLANRAFKIVKIAKTTDIHSRQICAKDAYEKKEMSQTLSKITTLNNNWARKCLDDSNWDFKKALEVFVDLYKLEKIPAEAFIKT